MQDPTRRFSDRVENYVRYRPDYPRPVLDTLEAECGLNASSVVADIGSGTGILSEQLLSRGAEVFAVEPNREMRSAAEERLRGRARFHSIEGTAERTTLAAGGFDLATAAQAFHWFEPAAARAEFRRILKPEGFAVLIWNDRCTDTTPFLVAYEDLLRDFSTDYLQVDHRRIDAAALDAFFGPSGFSGRSFEHKQEFDYPGLEGRLLSSSYAPGPGHPRHQPMLAELQRIYQAHQREGRVIFEYRTRVYFGRMS